MAAKTPPTSAFVETYADKTDEWVKARLEYLEGKERISHAGSILRRKEIWALRVEKRTRKEAADLAAAAIGTPAQPPPAKSAQTLTAAPKLAADKLATS